MTQIIPRFIPLLFRFAVVALALQGVTSGIIYAQTGVPGQQAVQLVMNMTHSSPFADADSADVLTLPQGSVITAAYWRVDTATVAVDSIQLRLGPSLVRVDAWTPDIEGTAGLIRTVRPDTPVTADNVLRARLFASPDAAGQVRLTIEWIPIY